MFCSILPVLFNLIFLLTFHSWSHDRIVITNGYSVCVHFLTRNHMHFNTLYHKTDRKTTLKDLQKSELSIVILPEGVFSSQLFNFY